MSSRPLERLARSFTLRLSFGYATLFTLSAVILFGMLYLLLASTVQRKDREIIEARLRECAAVYANGSLAALQDLVQRSRESDKDKSFFVRLAGQRGSVLLLAAGMPSGSNQSAPARPVGALKLRRRAGAGLGT